MIVVGALYAATRHHDFVAMDDPAYVYENPVVAEGLSGEGLRQAFSHRHAGYWLPLTWVSHMLDVELFGLDAGKHHLVNVALHALNVVLLLLLLSRMTDEFWPSVWVAALYAVHPLHVESVAWVAERKDVLSGSLWMLALLAWHGYVRHAVWWRYALVLLALAFGLMAKPMLVTLPVVLMLLDVWPLRRWRGTGDSGRPISRLLLEKTPLFGLVILFAVSTVVAQASAGAVSSLEVLTPGVRAANAAVSYVRYLASAFWPAGLSPYYPHPAMQSAAPMDDLAVPAVLASMLLLAISVWALRSIRRHPHRAVGWLWYVTVLLPVSGALQSGTQARADRFVYLPLIGIYMLLAWEIARRVPAGRVRIPLATVAVVVLAGLSSATWRQVGYWKDSRTLFERALAVDADNAWALSNLGAMDAADGKTERALERCRKAVELQPGYPEGQFNLGTLLGQRGDTAGAEACYERTLALRPGHSRAHNNMAGIRIGQQDLPGARYHLEQAVRWDPAFSEAHNNLALVLSWTGDPAGARSHYERAIELSPSYADPHFNLGVLLVDTGQPREAVEHFLVGLESDPPLSDADVFQELAAALAADGAFDEAFVWQQRAIADLPPERVEAARRRLERYHDRRE